MSEVAKWVGRRVSVMTSDGRHLTGILRGVDQLLNIVLQDSTETLYSEDAAPSQEDCGDYVIRGDDIVTIGPINTQREAEHDLSTVRFAGLPAI